MTTPTITSETRRYIDVIRQHLVRDYEQMYAAAGGALEYPYLVPGSAQYIDQLWDWDSWLMNVALRQILLEAGDAAASDAAKPYERGCVLNFLNGSSWHGYVPIVLGRKPHQMPENIYETNMHKPCLAQHAAFLARQHGDVEWLREAFYGIQAFLNNYRSHHRHSCGLYFWQNDRAIGEDNNPCVFDRPPRSTAAVYLNSLMYRELLAAAYLAEELNLPDTVQSLQRDADDVKAAIQEHCWDEWLGFYYSVDLNLTRPPLNVEAHGMGPHCGLSRDWPGLIQRIGVWSGFLPMWAGIATPEQAQRMVDEHYWNEQTFNCAAGIRTLSRMEKMFTVRASGNPSPWLGPVWAISNYLVFRGLVRYGFSEAAQDLCVKTIRLFGRDLERFGALHECYEPENGEPMLNRGFQNWNYLVLNMAAWLQGQPVVEEF
ncbi:MAG: glycoside hydrolase family 37 [Chloroflexi bacterium]|nr:glycoside hydrolase family 37 [Chloroflexota bacterium]